MVFSIIFAKRSIILINHINSNIALKLYNSKYLMF